MYDAEAVTKQTFIFTTVPIVRERTAGTTLGIFGFVLFVFGFLSVF